MSVSAAESRLGRGSRPDYWFSFRATASLIIGLSERQVCGISFLHLRGLSRKVTMNATTSLICWLVRSGFGIFVPFGIAGRDSRKRFNEAAVTLGLFAMSLKSGGWGDPA
jgi:hypothetical protein